MFTKQPISKTKTTAPPKLTPVDTSFAEASHEQNSLWQTLALNAAAIQTKLSISQPDDPYEQEADRVADRVMRMATPPSGAQSPPPQSGNIKLSYPTFGSREVQRKCDHCEEEEEEKKLQRTEASRHSDTASNPPPSVDQTLSSTGQPLDSNTRAFFGPRFGRDFSDVRVHDDASADASARSVNALAFTVGHHVAFRGGQYSPNTQGGQRLLAHELAHVVQQNGAGLQIQRTGPAPSTAAGSDFDVVGKPDETASDLNRIHFDKDSAVVDSDEETKLAAFSTDDVNLNAHQSEDEAAGTAGKRGAAVKKAFVDAGHDAAKLHVVDKGVESQIDYRAARIVEIVKVGMAALKSHCPVAPKLSDMAVACASVGRSAPFNAGLAAARAAIKKSRELLKTDVGKGTPSAATLDVVKNKFAKPSNADKVRNKLGEIDNFLKNLRPITECHNDCDPSCGTSAYWDPNRLRMVLCPDFDGLGAEDQAGTVMHEATHGVPTIKSDDLGYASDRMINFLDEAHAFKNTDSYTTLVQELAGLSTFADKVPADTFSSFGTRTIGGVAVAEKDLVQKAEALAEKWCIWAYQDLEFLYSGLTDAVAAGTVLIVIVQKEVMTSLHNHFALTDVATKPTMADKTAVAALRDKFLRFGISTFNQALAVKSVSGGASTAWGASTPAIPGGQFVVPPNLDIGDDFWAVGTDVERAKLLVAALARATKDATAAKASAYAEFAFDRSKKPERL
ncbi:MAG TPA: DUF4157 domain-containing protein [Pyrinomonadaceae bacterium]|jgi:hypothetical protein|nr:DUF4157 domain-containing protein [Pyrinomonadaceae bacterium]